MNIFQMYYDLEGVGFYVQRQSWRFNLFAKIHSIAGQTSGKLKGHGRYPYFDGAKELVLAEMYEVQENLDIVRIEPPEYAQSKQDPMLAVISCPGSYKYILIG